MTYFYRARPLLPPGSATVYCNRVILKIIPEKMTDIQCFQTGKIYTSKGKDTESQMVILNKKHIVIKYFLEGFIISVILTILLAAIIGLM